MDELQKLRLSINEVDDEIIELFQKRMDIVRNVAQYKKEKSMKILDRSRESAIIEKHTKDIENEDEKAYVREFLESLMYISRKMQKKLIKSWENSSKGSVLDNHDIGYQGVQGSFSYEALVKYFGNRCKTKSFPKFRDVFEAIKNGEIEYGVIPVENSSTGAITEIYDLLYEYGFFIKGEKYIKVEHNLMGIKGADINDVEEVYSHEQGFMQCREYLDFHEDWKMIPYFNTAKSAEFVSLENDKHKACIGSSMAAKIYGLEILKPHINYSDNNSTRFIIIGREMEYSRENDKISIIISLPHKAGSLYNLLRPFEKYGCNMLKIESRPIADKPWEYLFYIDCDGNVCDEKVKKALEEIEEGSLYFKLLGNYKCEVQ